VDAERDGARRAREDIVEEIVNNLRPWSQAEAAVHKGVVNNLDQLLDIDAKSRENVNSWTESKKAARELEPELSVLIEIVDGIPANNLLFKISDDFSSPSELLRQLRLLREMCARLERFKSVSKKVDLPQKFCAFFACGIISGFSKKPPTATVDGPLWAVASLLYEAVTGKPEVNMKRACDATLKVFKHARAMNKV
jgi:hypothetical protein